MLADWTVDPNVTANEALKQLVYRIQQGDPVKQRHLPLLYERCQTSKELENALKVTRLNYLARGRLRQHDPFPNAVTSSFVRNALRVEDPELATDTIVSPAQFGLKSIARERDFHPIIIKHSKQGNLPKMLEVYEFMKGLFASKAEHKDEDGPVKVRPGADTCHILVRGCVDNGRPDLATMLLEEFEASGARVRDGTRKYLEQNGEKHKS